MSEIVKASDGGRLERVNAGKDELGFVEMHGSPNGLVAIRVRGDGLSPTIDDGRILIISPGERCDPGEWVMLTLASGERMAKKLLILKADAAVLSDLATQEQRTIPFDEIESMEPITAVYSAKQWFPGDAAAVRGPSVFGDLDEAPAPSRKIGGPAR